MAAFAYADGNVLTAEQLNASFSGTAVPVATFAAGGSDDTTQLTNAFAYLQASPGNSISFAPGKTYTISALITMGLRTSRYSGMARRFRADRPTLRWLGMA
jgi:hypothetical protein